MAADSHALMLVDDHHIFRSGLSRLLSEGSDFEVTAEAASIDRACELLDERPDLEAIILDINLAGENALEKIPELRHHKADIPILVMSMYPPNQFAPAAYNAGANAYLTKDASPEELQTALEAILDGTIWRTDETTERDYCEGVYPHDRLSERELEILKLIAAGDSLTDIGDKVFLSVKTVSTYRSRILEKLHLANNAELVKYALNHGLAV